MKGPQYKAADPEDWRDAILSEAAGGPRATGIPTYDPRTGRLHYPGQGKKAVPPKNCRAKAKKRRKIAKASRKKNRRR